MTAVILINWNGAADTIDCLESLDRAEGEFFVVVADNGSTDNSVEVLAPLCENLKNHPIHLLKLDKNYGFAGGNNRAVKFAMKYNPESIMLLNNDTVVDSQFLLRLLDFSQKNVEYRVLSPCINYYYDKSLVWSCGGRLIFGSRKSYYRDVKYSDICNNAFLNISDTIISPAIVTAMSFFGIVLFFSFNRPICFLFAPQISQDVVSSYSVPHSSPAGSNIVFIFI